MRAYGVNKIRITSNLAGTSGIDLLQQNATDRRIHRAHVSRCLVRRVHDGGPGGETNFYLNNSFTRVLAGHQLKVGGQLARVNFLMDIDASQKGRWGFPVDVVLQPDRSSSAPTPSTPRSARPRMKRRSGITRSTCKTLAGRDSLTLNLGLLRRGHTITVGNGLVDARNARYLANGVAPLVEGQEGPQQRGSPARLRVGAHR